MSQIDKLARRNWQGNFRTKERYYEAWKRFCAYLADACHLQKQENVSGKHLVSYVLYLQESGIFASTFKTDLAAIRFSHDKMSKPIFIVYCPANPEPFTVRMICYAPLWSYNTGSPKLEDALNPHERNVTSKRWARRF